MADEIYPNNSLRTLEHCEQDVLGVVVVENNNNEEVESESEYTECPVCPVMSLKETSDPARKRSHYQVHKLVKKMRIKGQVLLKDSGDSNSGEGDDDALPSAKHHNEANGDAEIQPPVNRRHAEATSEQTTPPTRTTQYVRPRVGGGKPAAFDLQVKIYGSKRLQTSLMPQSWSYDEDEPAEEASLSVKVQCEICHKTINKRGIARHRRIHSNNRAMFPCPKCGKEFVSTKNVVRHLKSSLHKE